MNDLLCSTLHHQIWDGEFYFPRKHWHIYGRKEMHGNKMKLRVWKDAPFPVRGAKIVTVVRR